MSKKQDKAAKRKAKLKARKAHEAQNKLSLANHIANAVMSLCAPLLPEYVDDSHGPDLVGRDMLWRMGMVAWDVALSGRKTVTEEFIQQMQVDDASKEMVRDEINGLIRRKYEKYPDECSFISDCATTLVAGTPRLKVTLGITYPPVPIPNFDDKPIPLSPEELLAKRKDLGLSQIKFAAAIGVPVKKLSAWEHGKAVPTAEEIEKIKSYTLGKE